MRLRLKYLIFLLVFSLSTSSHAFSIEELKMSFRPMLENVFGQERVAAWYNDPQEIELPEIPEVSSDVRSVRAYDRHEVADTFDEERRRQYNYAFISELYQVVRAEQATRNDFATWMNTLEQGGSREGVYRALVLDNTYAGLENYSPDANREVQDFVISYMETYLARTPNRESLEEISFYTLKRIVVERTLDVINELTENHDDLFRWYAVFSAQMAREYPDIWTNDIRRNQQSYFHYRWAQNVPTQHIKSEVIIKIHSVMNHLMGI